MIGNQLAPVCTANVLPFNDQGADPPTSVTAPCIFRKGNALYLRDADGVLHPLVLGADGAGVVSVGAGSSPYQCLAQDQIILVDATAGVVTVKLVAAPYVGQQVVIVDAKRQFATNTCTIDGNGKTIRGLATLGLARRDGGVTLFYTGTDWELSISQFYAPDSITGVALQSSGLLRYLSSLGRNGAGAVTLTGTKAGDYVLGVVNNTDHTNAASSFETQISVNDQIQQSSASDLSAKTMHYLILAKS